MTIAEQIEIIQAYERGEEIECRTKCSSDSKWFSLTTKNTEHEFDFLHHEYRIKLKRWRAERGEFYYYIGAFGHIIARAQIDGNDDTFLYEFGNNFRTQKDAEKARRLLKETLNKFHEEND